MDAITFWDADVTAYVHNNTVYKVQNTASISEAVGLLQANATVTAQNNYIGGVNSTLGNEYCFRSVGAGSLTQTRNVSSDATAGGAGSQVQQLIFANYFVNVVNGSEDLHLTNNSNAIWGSYGADLDQDPDLPVVLDIDSGLRDRSLPDIGADEFGVTAVELVSFEAKPLHRGAMLSWETASELNNLGFHLYRSLSAEGPLRGASRRVSFPASARHPEAPLTTTTIRTSSTGRRTTTCSKTSRRPAPASTMDRSR